MVLDASLLNTQHYMVWIKGKEEHPPLHWGVVAIEKGAFRSLNYGRPTYIVSVYVFV